MHEGYLDLDLDDDEKRQVARDDGSDASFQERSLSHKIKFRLTKNSKQPTNKNQPIITMSKLANEVTPDDFLAALKNSRISSKTRKDISDKLKDYKDLLQETKFELHIQHMKAQKLSNAFDNLIFFLLPDVEIVKEALKDLKTDEEKKREVESFSSHFCCYSPSIQCRSRDLNLFSPHSFHDILVSQMGYPK